MLQKPEISFKKCILPFPDEIGLFVYWTVLVKLTYLRRHLSINGYVVQLYVRALNSVMLTF